MDVREGELDEWRRRLSKTMKRSTTLRFPGLWRPETRELCGSSPPATTVKTRHLRARRRLQDALDPELKSALAESFTFAGLDCEAMTESVVRAWCGDEAVTSGS